MTNTTNFLLLSVVILLGLLSIKPVLLMVVGIITGIIIRINFNSIKEKFNGTH